MDEFTLLEFPLIQSMWTLRAVYFLIALTMATSQKFPRRQTNELSTGERFFSDVHVVTREVQESALLQKKAMIDAVSAVNRAGLGILRDLKKSNSGMVDTLVDIGLAKLEAIRAARLVLLNMLASQIATLIQEVEYEDISDLLESPLFSYLVDLLLPLFSGSNFDNSRTATDMSNVARTQRDPETVANREYSSRDSTSSMQGPSSPATRFPLPRVSSSRSAGKVSNL